MKMIQMTEITDIKIRQAILSDCNDIYTVKQACFDDDMRISNLKYSVDGKFGFLFGAFDGKKAVGFINGTCIADEIEIDHVCVLPKYRHRHIGDRLIDFVLEKFGSEKSNFFLEVRESNTAAINLYKKHGFKQYGIRRNYYKNPVENAYLLMKGDSL